MPNLHVVQNMVFDFMHDIPEGVARYDMALVIKNLIDKKYFTLNQLNSRITLFYRTQKLSSKNKSEQLK